jgi:hypothetical protein
MNEMENQSRTDIIWKDMLNLDPIEDSLLFIELQITIYVNEVDLSNKKFCHGEKIASAPCSIQLGASILSSHVSSTYSSSQKMHPSICLTVARYVKKSGASDCHRYAKRTIVINNFLILEMHSLRSTLVMAFGWWWTSNNKSVG